MIYQEKLKAEVEMLRNDDTDEVTVIVRIAQCGGYEPKRVAKVSECKFPEVVLVKALRESADMIQNHPAFLKTEIGQQIRE